jgi:2-polyprenyl-6-methoxyphenol hydroxylase-like FAD-dependent oxidoreductase
MTGKPMDEQPTHERILYSGIFRQGKLPRDEQAHALPPGAPTVWREPSREIPVHAHCDVLVVGGGPSGTAAAIAAARVGADVILLERYNHLGGLSTGGLVIWIDRMTDWNGKLVIRGFGEEILSRLPADAVAGPPDREWGSTDADHVAHWGQRTAAYRGVVTWSPTIDPEWLKLASQELVLQSKVRLVYHSWAAEPIVEDGAVRGVLFENKAGRRAIRARVVIDATGDGDIYARAGAEFESNFADDDIHHCMNTAWLFGGVDMKQWIEFRVGQPEQYSAFMALGRERIGLIERPFVSWRDDIALFMGPRLAGYSAVDIDDQTEVEVRSHRAMAAHLSFYREHAPGFEHAYLMLSAPQLGVRHTRRLAGVSSVTRAQWPEGQVFADEIGVSPSLSQVFPSISIPYGSLVPKTLDGLLACGRHMSCDTNSHGFLREIPQCWVTGQAAGVAAAHAVQAKVEPRSVPVAPLQAELRRQGVYLQER